MIFHLESEVLYLILLSILRINDILKTQVICFIYDTLLGLSPIQFKSWFKFCIDVHDHATRNTTIVNNDEGTIDVDLTNNLFIPITRTTHYGLKSIKFYGPRL